MRIRPDFFSVCAVSVLLVAALAGCGSSSTASAPPASPSSVPPSTSASEGSTFGEPSGLWDIPRDVQVAYAKAVCTAPESEFGFGGTFDDTTLTCATRNDMTSDVSFLMRNLLAKDSTQMQQTVDQMLEQSGATVPECPRPGGSGETKNAAVTNECVIAAMQALTAYLND
ncbi:MAG: hypothetical protein ACKOAF_06555 [Actinomycetes bacterium]